MICNKLKDKLPEGWREKFVHRDCDQANYEFAMFEIDGENKILVRNPETDDIMEYYYDDFDGWIDIGKCKSIGKDTNKYCINSKLEIKLGNKVSSLEDNIIVDDRNHYPRKIFVIDKANVYLMVHRLVAEIFVPNPNPEEYKIVNHKDQNKENFSKTNLSWCNHHINNLKENQTKQTSKVVYLQKDQEGVIIRRWEYCNRKELFDSFPNVLKNIGKLYKGYYWERIDTTLEDYLSRHPIDPNGWHDDNIHGFKHTVRANTCGILEIDGILTVGCLAANSRLLYIITIDEQKLFVHRVLFEIIAGKRIDPGNVIDHIIPSTKLDINNEFSNLREVTQKENMNNEISRKNLGTVHILYDVFGNEVMRFDSGVEAGIKFGFNHKTSQAIAKLSLTWRNMIWTNESNLLDYKIRYIYYRWGINKVTGEKKVEEGSSYLKNIVKNGKTSTTSIIRNRYLNTGMPAPDGYYYQQGDPWNMLYDPDNKELVKKRPIIKWDRRNKNREDN